MVDVIFIGPPHEAEAFRAAGILCFQPSAQNLGERVLAERARCRVLAMTQVTFDALPPWLAQELRAASWPQLAIIPSPQTAVEAARGRALLRRLRAGAAPIAA